MDNAGTKKIPLKPIIDDALLHPNHVEKALLVYQHTGSPVHMHADRDLWWHETINDRIRDFMATTTQAEHIIYFIYQWKTPNQSSIPVPVIWYFATYGFVNVFQYKKGQIHFVRQISVG